jgi:hypothetical protein
MRGDVWRYDNSWASLKSKNRILSIGSLNKLLIAGFKDLKRHIPSGGLS